MVAVLKYGFKYRKVLFLKLFTHTCVCVCVCVPIFHTHTHPFGEVWCSSSFLHTGCNNLTTFLFGWSVPMARWMQFLWELPLPDWPSAPFQETKGLAHALWELAHVHYEAVRGRKAGGGGSPACLLAPSQVQLTLQPSWLSHAQPIAVLVR